MSNRTKTHIPCPKCSSSDAYCEYEDGHGYCFSCNTYIPAEGYEKDNYSFQTMEERGLSKWALAKYGIKVATENMVPCHWIFPYADGTKYRNFNNKEFWGTKGMSAGLFGKEQFPAGGKYITVTEGEFDAASVYQMFDYKYPAVSVRSSSTAKKDCTADHQYLDSFERIYLCFDNDDAGNKATKEVASLFDFNKVYIVKLDKHNDPNAYLQNDDTEAFKKVWWGAKRAIPEGIISSFDEVRQELDTRPTTPLAEYPFQSLQEATFGIRGGEVSLFKAEEGIGKTEIIRAIEYHVLTTTDHNVGIIHLEESKARLIKGLAGYSLGKPCHLPNSEIENEKIFEAYEKSVQRNDRCVLYSNHSTDDPSSILNTIRFLVSGLGCKIIFLDHITMLVTGSTEENERKQLDFLSTKLEHLVEELDFALVMITHINNSEERATRGSKNISKCAHLVVDLRRDITHDNPQIKNTTELVIVKNRFSGVTGKCGEVYFDPMTFMISDKDQRMEFPE
jgi:twinkle protein